MHALRTLLLMLALVAVTLALLLAGGTGVGVLLHRLIPEAGLGTAILIGVVALAVSVHWVMSMFVRAQDTASRMDDEEFEAFVTALQRPTRKGSRRR